MKQTFKRRNNSAQERTGKSSKTSKVKPKANDKSENLVRLNKVLANAGICSRREADKLIEAGLVKVNGEIITELGYKVAPNDDVRYNDERLKSERLVYILMNKPRNFITTLEDPQERNTVIHLLRNKVKERVYPVGRLDRNTTGVLLLTNDGELTKRLTHPSYEKKKIYHVSLNKSFSGNDFKKVLEGLNLEDGFIKADAMSYVHPEKKSEIGVEIHSGRNRIIRRIFEHLGYEVLKLDRVYFAGLTKKNLQRGEWRFLDEKEINLLKMNAFS